MPFREQKLTARSKKRISNFFLVISKSKQNPCDSSRGLFLKMDNDRFIIFIPHIYVYEEICWFFAAYSQRLPFLRTSPGHYSSRQDLWKIICGRTNEPGL